MRIKYHPHWFWHYDDDDTFLLSENSSSIRWYQYSLGGQKFDVLFVPGKKSFIQSNIELNLTDATNVTLADRDTLTFRIKASNETYTIKSGWIDQSYCVEKSSGTVKIIPRPTIENDECKFINISSGKYSHVQKY